MKTFLALMLLAWACAGGFSDAAFAHKVVGGAYASGDHIEGEIGFSDGSVAKNALIEVLGEDGGKLGETRTGEDGTFSFTPTKRVVHIFHSDLGGGHIANIRVEVEDLPASLKAGGEAAAPAAKTAEAPAAASTGGTPAAAQPAFVSDAQKAALLEAVRNEVKPLRREIIALKEKNDFQSILGGIGYIIGLFGLWFFVAARRQKPPTA